MKTNKQTKKDNLQAVGGKGLENNNHDQPKALDWKIQKSAPRDVREEPDSTLSKPKGQQIS